MKKLICALLLFNSAGLAAETPPTPDEMLAIVQGVGKRVNAGETAALEDLRKLPADDAVASLLMFFKGGFYAYKAEPHQKATAAKAAKMIPEIPGAEAYFEKMWKKPEGVRSGRLVALRDTSIDCLGEANNKFGVRMLIAALGSEDLGEQRKKVLRTLMKMDIPNAPYPQVKYPQPYPKGSTNMEGLLKWQAWWEENKAAYQPDQ